jgi:hypothetical protein
MAEERKLEGRLKTATLYRNDNGTGRHRMTVQHETGNMDDVVIAQDENGKPKLKRRGQQIVFHVPSSPIADSTSSGAEVLEDLDEEDETRLLAIYKLFPEKQPVEK